MGPHSCIGAKAPAENLVREPNWHSQLLFMKKPVQTGGSAALQEHGKDPYLFEDRRNSRCYI